MRNEEGKDTYLEERLARYDQWIRERKVPTSSKVIPIQKSLSGLQWVLPTQQALEILRNARVSPSQIATAVPATSAATIPAKSAS